MFFTRRKRSFNPQVLRAQCSPGFISHGPRPMVRRSSYLAIAALGGCLLATSPATQAACMRLDSSPAPDASAPPDFDGPGAFGALHDTLTLNCLRYEGRVQGEDSGPVALVRDNRGKLFHIKVGDFVGENTGQVIAIDADRIVVHQLVPGPDIGGWTSVERYLFRIPPE